MMNAKGTITFHLPEGWTLRKVVTTLVQEWLPPFRAEPAFKAARWVLQAVMEGGKEDAPLWEPGITTEEYENRVDREIRSWAIRATAGRAKGTILAHLIVDDEQPRAFQLVTAQNGFPETLFDAAKVKEYLDGRGAEGDGLFAALLAEHGFRSA